MISPNERPYTICWYHKDDIHTQFMSPNFFDHSRAVELAEVANTHFTEAFHWAVVDYRNHNQEEITKEI